VNCAGVFALEIDHRKPRALGGNSEPENLRLLWRSCNQRAAIKSIGLEKMATFLERN
jgi:5-methylcytosine-specific restriction endonuclease McrA